MKTAQQLCEEQGVDRARLKEALDSNDNWGKMVYAFEYLTAVSAVLASWPDPESCDVCGQPDNCGDCNHYGTVHYKEGADDE